MKGNLMKGKMKGHFRKGKKGTVHELEFIRWSLTGGCNDGERENWEWGKCKFMIKHYRYTTLYAFNLCVNRLI